ncbi:RRM domain-containing protein [Cyclospora cayetanensis]|uniref:RRM domain-containing protein n=1 Tax=Cyclospora cayetanensis TaxID=88456 RepID=A0A1D3D8U9_9EIME|nr:RRM domain-containing protein [Cyclospora cayetanensis]
MPSHQRETKSRAADAPRRDASITASAGASGPPGTSQDSNALLRGSVARSHSIEPWDAADRGRGKRAAAAGTGSIDRLESSRRGFYGGPSGSAIAADAGSSASSNPSGDHGRRAAGEVVASRSSSRAHPQGGPPLVARRNSTASLASSSSESQDEEATCPLCLEALDETDRGLFPCECGYQVCLWCLHHIRDHLANKCPACRRDYDEKKFKYDQSRVVELTKQIGRKSREKVCGSAEATRSGSSGSVPVSRTGCTAAAARGGAASSGLGVSSSSSSSSRGLPVQQQGVGAARLGSREAAVPAPAQAAALKDVRVIQRCLVYVIGIPPSIAKKEVSQVFPVGKGGGWDEHDVRNVGGFLAFGGLLACVYILRRHEFFGQYGKVLQIVVNKNQGHWGGPSFAVYVTYSSSKEAVAAIQGVDGAVYEGRTLKASFGTTKYCSHFLKGVKCQNPDCSYLHQLGSGKDSFTKEAMISAKHQFLDLTFPSNSERKPTTSLFGKLPDAANRNTQREDPLEGPGNSGVL